MKRKLIVAALMMSVAVIIGCSPDRRTPTEKANALLKTRHLQTVMGLDSVRGYEDEHRLLMSANNLQWHADSIRLHHLSQKRLITKDEKKTVLEDAHIVYKLKVDAAGQRLQHQLEKKPETFVGYSVIMGDSVTGSVMTVYFDKDVTKIESIDRKVSYE